MSGNNSDLLGGGGPGNTELRIMSSIEPANVGPVDKAIAPKTIAKSGFIWSASNPSAYKARLQSQNVPSLVRLQQVSLCLAEGPLLFFLGPARELCAPVNRRQPQLNL